MLLLRVLALLGVLAFGSGRSDPKFLNGCGGWRHCLETQFGTDEALLWFGTWNMTLQPKLDQLIDTSKAQAEGSWAGKKGLLLVMAGDSTIIQQFQVLSEYVRLRSDFYPVTGPDAERLQKYELTFGGTRNTPGSVTFVFYRVFEQCMLHPSNPHVHKAYALYFGCGMHLLHLIPTFSPPMISLALENWANYGELLTGRVEEYRGNNPDIKLVYMTTHAIDESKYFGAWSDALEAFKTRHSFYMNACTSKFKESLPKDSPLQDDLGQACVDATFGSRGVELLNEKGLAAMARAGVPVVPAHQLVARQSWATIRGDGRHYPYMVPLELFWWLNTLEMMP